MREGSAYRNVVEGDAGLGHLLELRLVAREVHGPAHGAHRAAPAAAAGAPEQEEQAAEGDEGEQQVACQGMHSSMSVPASLYVHATLLGNCAHWRDHQAGHKCSSLEMHAPDTTSLQQQAKVLHACYYYGVHAPCCPVQMCMLLLCNK